MSVRRLRRGTVSDLSATAPLKPLLAFMLLAAGALAVQPDGSNWRLVGGAFFVVAATAFVVAFVPLQAGSAWRALVPAVPVLLAVALLRQSQGGSLSGYSPLAILPVIWVALAADRRAVRVVTACSGLMFALPLLLIGAPEYPSSGWRGAVLWTLVAFLVGMVVNAGVAEQRVQAAEARRHAAELEEMHRAFAAVSRVARTVALGTDARELVCAAAVEITGARLATVVEPRGDEFAITGSAGLAMDPGELRSVQPSASLRAYRAGHAVLVPDVSMEPGVSPAIIRATGIASVLYEPIMRDGSSVGVLCVAWETTRAQVDENSRAIIQFLAAEAGAAIERADLLARLDSQARSDELTALPNRRAWDETLARAMSFTVPVCVAMIDIDHFKRYNDHHGHTMGDRLLRACALAWKSHLRPGDTLARYGGEEFAVLLPDCTLPAASEVLERLRSATPSGVTASVGVAERELDESAAEVLARADAALYAAKHTGRDQLRAA